MGDGPSMSPEAITPQSLEAAKSSVEVPMRMGGGLRINRLSQVGSNFTEDNKPRDFKGKEHPLSALTEADRKTISELPIGIQDPFGKWEAEAIINTIGERDSNNLFKGVKSTRLELDISPTDKEPKIDLSRILNLRNTEEPDPKDPSHNKRLKVTAFTLNVPVKIAGQVIDSVRVAIPALKPSESAQQKEVKNPQQLGLRDLMFLRKNSLGLRHVSDMSTAMKENENGIKGGDALAIGTLKNFMPEGPFVALEHMSQKEQAEVITKYEAALRNFVWSSVGIDMNTVYAESDTETSLVKKFLEVGKGAFLLAKFQGASNGYDQEQYYGFGKAGEQDVPRDEIKGAVSIKEADVDFSSLKNELVGEEAWNKAREILGNAFYGKLVDQIRLLQEISPTQSLANEAVEALKTIPSSEIEMSGGGKIKIASIKSIGSLLNRGDLGGKDYPLSSLIEADRETISNLPFWIESPKGKEPNEKREIESPAIMDIIVFADIWDADARTFNSTLMLDFHEDYSGLRFEPNKMKNIRIDVEDGKSIIAFEPESELKINGKYIQKIRISVPPMAQLAKVPESEAVRAPVTPIVPRRREMVMA